MPEALSGIDIHKKGDFADTSLESVKEFLGDCNNVVFHPGFFPVTAEPVKDKKFCFVYFDADLYQSTKSCLEFFYPRMVRGGVMIFDDYEWKGCPGLKKAIEEFLADKSEIPIITAKYQCMLLKD
jgi:predicted O-methyltransferase YrrM